MTKKMTVMKTLLELNLQVAIPEKAAILETAWMVMEVPRKAAPSNNDSEDLYRNDCEYEISKDQLSREMKKDKPNISRVKQLMDATYNQRREWIEYNAPSVSEVFEEYPSLRNGKVVSIIFWLAACECVCECMLFVCIV